MTTTNCATVAGSLFAGTVIGDCEAAGLHDPIDAISIAPGSGTLTGSRSLFISSDNKIWVTKPNLFKSEFLFPWKSNIPITHTSDDGTVGGYRWSVNRNKVNTATSSFVNAGGRNSRDTAYRIASPQGGTLDAVKIISMNESSGYIDTSLIEFSNGEQYWLRLGDGSLYNTTGSNFKDPALALVHMGQNLEYLCGSDLNCDPAGQAASGDFDSLEAGVGWIKQAHPLAQKYWITPLPNLLR